MVSHFFAATMMNDQKSDGLDEKVCEFVRV